MKLLLKDNRTQCPEVLSEIVNEDAGLALTDDLRNYNFDDTDEYCYNCQDSLRSYNNQNDIFKTSSVSIYDGE